ncbi:hypothetical protein RFI_35331 [Reticulomyxa filosa]|uniref:Uncharacterized protein n=1 Tax=Reticulomyxa filosa TaxID=46433 RepID=X6LKF5_RETFI|nr:hypothetical protein RFI_35331 [Reticulomyxa filosa]|eukprot:ETO02104.1 hypothetical protein RFI_35331 [Reticulomyxa filosa]
MGLYEEAVNLALNVPDNLFELARSVVENLKRKEPMAADEQKKLWLIIARYVVKDSQEDLDQALSLINESKCLSIEDILPYLSDFTNIGLFKPEIKSSLERYSVNIKKLQDHMKTYTDTAEEIRKDTDTLRQRSTFFFLVIKNAAYLNFRLCCPIICYSRVDICTYITITFQNSLFFLKKKMEKLVF